MADTVMQYLLVGIIPMKAALCLRCDESWSNEEDVDAVSGLAIR